MKSSHRILLVFVLCLFLLLFYFHFYYTKIEDFSQLKDAASIHEKIDGIYYINLKHRADRKSEFLSNFSHKDEPKIKRIQAHYYPENGAVGCLMSHISALNRALEGPEENILICEDDFYIKDMSYCNKMLDLFFENFQKWDVVMLGHNTVESKDTNIKTNENQKIIKIVNSQTASCYLIKKKYIPVLLQIYEKDMMNYLRTNEWGNYYTDQSWKVLQPVDNWYSFEPKVGVQRKSYSDIQKGKIDVEV